MDSGRFSSLWRRWRIPAAMAGGCCLLLAVGCAELRAPASPLARTERGQLLLDPASLDRLALVRHSCRRDPAGRLVVLVCFHNGGEKDYEAKVQVAFADERGTFEKWAFDMDIQAFKPGDTTLEYVSHTPDAAGYTIEVRRARRFPW